MSTATVSERGLPRVLAGLPPRGVVSLDEHMERLGPLPSTQRARAQMVPLVEESGLLGRGGGAFPVGAKMRAVSSGARRAIVVANGAEAEPASEKDRLLLEALPHLVLDGAALAAAAVGAKEALICVKRNEGAALASVAAALREREQSRLDRADLQLVEVPDHYLAGEESALVNYLNTGLAAPTFIPPRPFQKGVSGRPTLVQNVETLAHVALIGRFGASWYRGIGTAEDPGSILITLSGSVAAPGVYELAGGAPLEELLRAAGGPAQPPQAFLIGGYAGCWHPADQGPTLRLGHAAMRNAGGSLGPGIVHALPVGACGVAETARVARFMAAESAGQCGPCVFGLAALAGAMEELSNGSGSPRTHAQIQRWNQDVAGRGACRHPDGAVRLIASCLRTFAADIERHEQGEPCAQGGGPAELLPLPSLITNQAIAAGQ